eukprot:TRINITY_DN43726_c0_g1_i1.p1 TRINITY_DN43726_c0_g1~~TRINITY_DN43726_c0_g1_i1.p1  ORF type:complete len:133 (+),score=28.48 TRINITY_DN43726_c0_g1_i1:163-561(+)
MPPRKSASRAPKDAASASSGKPTAKVLAALREVRIYDDVPEKLLGFNEFRSHSLLWRLSERYNLESGLYMFERWERWTLNSILVVFIFFMSISGVSIVQWLLGAPQINTIIWSKVLEAVFGAAVAPKPPVEY